MKLVGKESRGLDLDLDLDLDLSYLGWKEKEQRKMCY